MRFNSQLVILALCALEGAVISTTAFVAPSKWSSNSALFNYQQYSNSGESGEFLGGSGNRRNDNPSRTIGSNRGEQNGPQQFYNGQPDLQGGYGNRNQNQSSTRQRFHQQNNNGYSMQQQNNMNGYSMNQQGGGSMNGYPSQRQGGGFRMQQGSMNGYPSQQPGGGGFRMQQGGGNMNGFPSQQQGGGFRMQQGGGNMGGFNSQRPHGAFGPTLHERMMMGPRNQQQQQMMGEGSHGGFPQQSFYSDQNRMSGQRGFGQGGQIGNSRAWNLWSQSQRNGRGGPMDFPMEGGMMMGNGDEEHMMMVEEDQRRMMGGRGGNNMMSRMQERGGFPAGMVDRPMMGGGRDNRYGNMMTGPQDGMMQGGMMQGGGSYQEQGMMNRPSQYY